MPLLVGTIRKRSRLACVGAAAALLAASFLPATAPAALADTRGSLVEQQRAQENARQDLGNQLDGVDAELGEAYLALADAQAKLPIAEAELAAAQTRVDQISDRLTQAESESAILAAEISQGTVNIDETRSSLGELARDAYRTGGAAKSFGMLTGATSSEEFMNQALVSTAAARSQRDVLVTLETDVAQNRNKEARQQAIAERVTQLKEDAVVAEQDAQAKRDEVAALEAEAAARTAELEARKADIAAQVAESEAASQRIAAEIARIDEENRRNQVIFSSQGAGAGVRVESYGNGRFSPPAKACVNSEWGMRIHPILGYAKMHEGLDMRAGTGVPQVAMTDGVVVSVYNDVGGGLMVVINHGLIDGNSVVTKHLHLSSASVRVGTRVVKGQVIGLTGATGRVTGPHVHHEVWVNAKSVNPRTYYGDQIRAC